MRGHPNTVQIYIRIYTQDFDPLLLSSFCD